MNVPRLTAVFLTLLWISCLAPADAAQEFAKVGWVGAGVRWLDSDARSAAMGGAYTAVISGAQAAFWNMGALALAERAFSGSFSNSEWISDTWVRSLSGSFGLAGFGVGGSATWLGMDEQHVRTVYQPEGNGRSFDNSGFVGNLGGGLDLRRLFGDMPENLAVGAGAGFVYYQNSLANHTGEALDGDLGIIVTYDYSPQFMLAGGYTIRNVFEQSMVFIENEVRLERRDRLGFAATYTSAEDLLSGPLAKIILALDGERVLFPEFDWDIGTKRAGAELCLAGIFSARGGFVLYSGDYYDVRWGLGLCLKPGNPFIPNLSGGIDFARIDHELFKPYNYLSVHVSVDLQQ